MTNPFSSPISHAAPPAPTSLRVRRVCASALLALLSLQSIVGCGSDSRDPDQSTGDSSAYETTHASAHLRISTEIDGTRYYADLTHRDAALVGTRTVTHPDGQIETEDVSIALDAEGVPDALDTLGNAAPSAGLRVVQNESTAEGTSYVLENDAGLSFFVETEGDSEYFLAEAAAVLITATIVCGVVAVTSIISCAARNRCWSFSGSLRDVVAFCGGNCKKC